MGAFPEDLEDLGVNLDANVGVVNGVLVSIFNLGVHELPEGLLCDPVDHLHDVLPGQLSNLAGHLISQILEDIRLIDLGPLQADLDGEVLVEGHEDGLDLVDMKELHMKKELIR